MKANVPAAVALALGLIMAGCASTQEAAKPPAPRVSAEELRTGGLAVLGVVQVNEVDQVRPPLIAALDSVLAARRPDLRLVRFPAVRAALDDSTARMLLLGYQIHGVAEPAWLARAADSLGDDARYGALGRVLSERLRHEDREGEPDSTGERRKVLVTVHEALVSVHVYDLRDRSLVFQGDFTGSGARTAPRRPPPEMRPASGWLTGEDIRREARAAHERAYPEPPPLASAAAAAFASFADSLPGK